MKTLIQIIAVSTIIIFIGCDNFVDIDGDLFNLHADDDINLYIDDIDPLENSILEEGDIISIAVDYSIDSFDSGSDWEVCLRVISSIKNYDYDLACADIYSRHGFEILDYEVSESFLLNTTYDYPFRLYVKLYEVEMFGRWNETREINFQ